MANSLAYHFTVETHWPAMREVRNFAYIADMSSTARSLKQFNFGCDIKAGSQQ